MHMLLLCALALPASALDTASARISGALLRPFGGRPGAVHEVVATAGGGEMSLACASAPAARVTAAGAMADARGVLAAARASCGLLVAGGPALADASGTRATVLGASPDALDAVAVLAAAGVAIRVVTPRRGGTDAALERGAAEALHPAALAPDDDDDDEEFEDDDDAFAGAPVLDFAGDEGARPGYASAVDADAKFFLDRGLLEAAPEAVACPSARNPNRISGYGSTRAFRNEFCRGCVGELRGTFKPTGPDETAVPRVRFDGGMRIVLGVPQKTSGGILRRFRWAGEPLGGFPSGARTEAPGFSLNPVALRLGPAAAAEYDECAGWPRDADTGRRYGVDAVVQGLSSVRWEDLDAALEAPYAYDEDVEGAAPAAVAAATEGDAVVFVTAKFCNACRRLEPHFARLERRGGAVSYVRVDATTDRAFANALGITSTPTFVLYRRGALVATLGTSSPTALRRAIADAFTT